MKYLIAIIALMALVSCSQTTPTVSPISTPTLEELPATSIVYRYDGTAPYTVTNSFLPIVYNVTDVFTNPLVFDEQGNEQSWDWLIATFGEITIERADDPGAARIIALHASTGPSVIVVHTQSADGTPNGCTTVVRFWPGAPIIDDPNLHGCGKNQGVYGSTNSEGDIGFGLGAGDYYWPGDGQVGATTIWIGRRPSDCISGLGMVGGTEHRTLFPVFEIP